MRFYSPQPLAFQEIEEGVFVCTDELQLREWLQAYPQLAALVSAQKAATDYLFPLVTNTGQGFEVYFFISEFTRRQPRFCLLKIRQFLSKNFNLMDLKETYPSLDVEKLFEEMCIQFKEVVVKNGFPLPIRGIYNPSFAGFFCNVEGVRGSN